MRLQGDKDGNGLKQQNDKEYPKFTYERKGEGNMFKRNHDKDCVAKKDDSDVNKGAARCWLWNADPALRDVVAREALQWRRSVMSQVNHFQNMCILN